MTQIDTTTSYIYVKKLNKSTKINFNPKLDIILDYEKLFEFHSNAIEFKAIGNNNEIILNKVYYSIGGGIVISDNKIESVPKTPGFPYIYSSATELFDLCNENDMNIWDKEKVVTGFTVAVHINDSPVPFEFESSKMDKYKK